jgi:hypothetical protein
LLAGAALRHLAEGLQAAYHGEEAGQSQAELKGAHVKPCTVR